MRMRIGFAILIILLVSIGTYAGAEPPKPEDLIVKLYKEHQPQQGKGLSFYDKKTLSRYFAEDTAALFLRVKEFEKRTGDVGLDFDPIYNAQEYDDNTNLNLTIKTIGTTPPLQLQVEFTNLGRNTLIYELKETKNGWRISDILYQEPPSSLRKILNDVVQ